MLEKKRISTRKYRWLYGAIGICLALIIGIPAAAQDTIVSGGSTWKYLDNGSNQGTAWRGTSFNDSSWDSGPAQLGYGDNDEATVVSYGSSSSNKYPTTYFRKQFSVTDPNDYGSLTLRVIRDDGAIVYLNGTEIWRSNMPSGSVNYLTYSTGSVAGSDEDAWNTTTGISSTLLQAGTNTLAVEIHQRSAGSSDISFDLQLLGTLGSSTVTVTRGPYLQMATPSAVTLRWRTDAAGNSRVRYGTQASNLHQSASSSTVTTEHEVRLTGLQSGTRYYYAVGSSSEDHATGSSFFFETPPAVGSTQNTRIWVIGDSGTANSNAANVYNAYRGYAGSDYTHLLLMLGDNAYNDGFDAEYQSAVFDMYPELLRQTVVWSTLGNHDGYQADSDTQTGPYYDIFTFPRLAEAGGVASGTEAYYSFEYANAHFIVLDSYETDRSVGGDMFTWLESDLQATTADWVIAFWHHPPYSKGSHDSDSDTRMSEMRSRALPILESYGVDLVLSGHSHAYERSYLLDGHYGKSNTLNSSMVVDSGSGNPAGSGAYDKPLGLSANQGAVYVVAGSSGKVSSSGNLNHAAMYYSLRDMGSLVLDLNDQQLDVRFLEDDGDIRDRFQITKGGGSCVVTQTPEASCSDGIDNDCDGLFDCNDSDCATSPSCAAGGGNGPQDAVYDSALGAPKCAIAGSECDSVVLLDSRGTLNPAEPNQPNTLGTCTDGTNGSYHQDESIDQVVVRTLDGSDFAPGKTVEVAVTVYPWSSGTQDYLDLYYAADATNPTWQPIQTINLASGGLQTLTVQYTLPAGSLQAVRANFRYRGSASTCGTGSYDDTDDLVFAVDQ